MKRKYSLLLGGLVAAAAALPLAQAQAATCEDLVGRKVGGGVVVAAERVAAGRQLSVTGLMQVPVAPVSAPFCRVKARLAPVAGSNINVEVWLPETWNGKLVATGGGGFNGGLSLAPMSLNPLVEKGYAAAASDAGHPEAAGAEWAYRQPAKLVDYGHRGNHVTAQFAKVLIATYYARPIVRAYFQGCSNGGRDALMEARRYPQDFDGIVAGAPAAPITRDITAATHILRLLDGPPAVDLSPAKLKLINDAVMARCDDLDGVRDGVLERPSACKFDPSVLQCKAGQGGDCLSAAEVGVVSAIYRGARTSGGRQVSEGLAVGGETVEWTSWLTGPQAIHRVLGPEFFKWMVYGDPSWSLARFNLDRDFAEANRRLGPVLDSDDPDIRPFLKRGGKLILYHGWADAALAPGNTVAYYEAVQRTAGVRADQVRLFMAPGMGHCSGGSGPNNFDMLSALDSWMDGGPAPERIIASKLENPLAAVAGLPVKTLQTRPLCAWPKQAQWNGRGSTDDAANFSCSLRRED